MLSDGYDIIYIGHFDAMGLYCVDILNAAGYRIMHTDTLDGINKKNILIYY